MNFEFVVVPLLVLVVALVVLALGIRRWGVLRNERYGKVRRIGERAVLAVLMVGVVAAGASAAFNAFASHHYWAAHPVPGRIYRVNGYKMRIDCTGAGSPTLVLDAGLGNDGLIWGKVQPELSRTTRVCSYDRAGFGWSEATPGPQDADHIAEQLHGLLDQAGIDGPIVLMGHSIAGIYIRAYASHFPQHVAGLIFVDGSTPLQMEHFPADVQARMKKTETMAFVLGKAVVPLGLLRVLGQCSQIPAGFAPGAGKMLAEDNCEPRVKASEREMNNFQQSGNETVHTGPYGNLPILIFSQDPNLHADILSAKMGKEVSATWNEMQDNLKALSTRSRRIIAKGSTHYVQIDRSDLVNREVPIFIQQIRGTAPQATDYGSTTTE